MSIQTSDAALKSAQVAITINTNGVPQGYIGTVNVGSGFTAGPGSDTVINGASVVNGTISALVGASVTDSGQFTSSSTVDVTGNSGRAGGQSAQLTEGAKLKSSGNIQGGDGLSLSSGSISGGNASVALADSATFPNFSIASGSDDTSGPNVGAGGSAYLGLTSSKTSLALTIGFGGSSGTAQINVTIAGSSLATITPSFSGSYSPGSGGSLNLDFSGCVLVDAAIDAIVNGLMSIGIQTGAANLNVGGSCHPASTGTQTDIATLQGRGWNVIYNT